jgi:hypothetical protein
MIDSHTHTHTHTHQNNKRTWENKRCFFLSSSEMSMKYYKKYYKEIKRERIERETGGDTD